MRNPLKASLLALTVFGLGACQKSAPAGAASAGHAEAQAPASQPAQELEAHAAATQAHAPGAAHWTYDDFAQWGAVSPESKACAEGKTQSPVALVTEAKVDLPNLVTAYAPSEGQVFNNGHTIQTKITPGQTLNIGDKVYQLLQAHFHHPSEHSLDGVVYPMELHFVHKSESGEFAVLGVMIKEGKANAQIQKIWDAIPASVGEEHAQSTAFDGNALLPATKVYFAYQGSLTTPPCTEGIRWNVLSVPIEASAEQIAAFGKAVSPNARPIQPLLARDILEGQ